MSRELRPVTGVDPGGRYLGIATRRGADLLSARVVDRYRYPGALELEGWLRVVLELILDEVEPLEAPLLAVEGVRAPTGHARGRPGHIINPKGILETAAVFGAIVGHWPDVVVVEPAGNGSAIPAAYPAGIRSGVRLGGPSEHARSAYDVAAKAVGIDRLVRAVEAAR